MDMYLLLRNNKQSGPYSFEELKGMGLKAYDLVWLEGKSAAWRYPCEIDELSAFAPQVEEQPFDRFYKRPTATASASATATATAPVKSPAGSTTLSTTTAPPVTTTTTSAPPAAPAATPAPAAPLYTGEPSAVPGKRIIYVTMPAGRTPAPVREIPREPVRELPKEPARPAQALAPVAQPGIPDPAHRAYASGPGYTSPRAEDYSSQ
ncbi:MAG TPA: hypothetical protein VKQ52_10830, partial [Puia sp.]|nr:hypothetical protein [Puia sp.]